MRPALDEYLIQRAAAFAGAAHYACEQVRKYTGEPYIHHPARVAHHVKQAGGSSEQIAAGWLHDVVEDTPIKIEVIEAYFGPKVMTLVDALTEPPPEEGLNRKLRAERTRAKWLTAPDDAKPVKLADIIDNCEAIADADPAFAPVYLKEKRLLLPLLGNWRDPIATALYKRAEEVIAAAEATLKGKKK